MSTWMEVVLLANKTRFAPSMTSLSTARIHTVVVSHCRTSEVDRPVPGCENRKGEGHDTQTLVVGRHSHDRWRPGRVLWGRP